MRHSIEPRDNLEVSQKSLLKKYTHKMRIK